MSWRCFTPYDRIRGGVVYRTARRPSKPEEWVQFLPPLPKMLTKIIVRLRKKYCGWCRAAYIFYREVLGHSRLRAWRGAFILSPHGVSEST